MEEDPGKRAPAPSERAPAEDESRALGALFVELHVGGSARAKAGLGDEAQEYLAELLRLGYTADQLRLALVDPTRSFEEWPREFSARFRSARRPPDRRKRLKTTSGPARDKESQDGAKDPVERVKVSEMAREVLRRRGIKPAEEQPA